MNIDLTLEELQELNQCLALLKSYDIDSEVLGLEMFRASSVFRNNMYQFKYESRPGKWIPVSWYMSKALEIARKPRENDNTFGENFTHLIIPLIEAILFHEPKFQVGVVFNTNRDTLLRRYYPESQLGEIANGGS